LESLAFEEEAGRYELAAGQEVAGASGAGIAESFPLDGARTLYGATKLSAELLATEYAEAFGLRTVVNRCGVIAGPWQMGRVDQGVFTHWILSHYFRREISYIGYQGTGKQVRDLLHVADLVDLLDEQLVDPEGWAGAVVNVGGGRDVSLSLREATALCQELTGNVVPVHASPAPRPGDVRIYLSDCRRLFARTAWRPRRGSREVLADTLAWIAAHEGAVRRSLVG
jgi:CDP-paratose 2-epimerase